jgi:hypothetical protein
MLNIGFRSSPREREQNEESRCRPQPVAEYVARLVATLLVPLFLGIVPASIADAQNVSIGTAAANNSALLHLESTTKGFLIPRMTDAQMWAIASPYTGDMVFNTTYTTFYYWNGTIWTPFIGAGWSITGDAGTSASTNFLGTKDAQDLVQKTNVKERIRVFSGGDVGLRNTYDVAEILRFYEPSGSGTDYIGFRAGIQAATVRYIWPLADGTQNQCLVTDGSGNLSWHTFAVVGGFDISNLWARGSGTYSEYSLGSGNKTNAKYAIAGGTDNTGSGQSVAVWGDNDLASGAQSVVSGGYQNQAKGQSSDIQGGAWNTASGQGGHIGGGLYNSTSGAHATIVSGDSNDISGAEAVVLNGHNNKGASQDVLMFGANITANGGNQLIFYPPTPPECRMGIQTVAPTQATDVVGNIRLSSALKPNNTGGTSGQYLTSAGSGTPPTWGTLTIATTNWRLLGSSGTSPATNFIGTTDANDFVIKTNSTERARVTSAGLVGINTSSPAHPLHSVYAGTTDEIAAVSGRATGTSANQMVGVWGRTNGSGSSNTGTIAVLAKGSGNTTAGQTNVALQINGGEFTMGRTTENPSKGTNGVGAAAGTAYTAQGPSGSIVLTMGSDLNPLAPVAGVFQDLGTMTINNRYITTSSIILVNVVDKVDGGGAPSPKNCMYKVDVESRAAGSCVIRLGMMPFVTDASSFQGSDGIRIAYAVVNPGK